MMKNTNDYVLTRDQNKVGNLDGAYDTKNLYSAKQEESVDMGVADGAMSLLLEMLSDVSSNRGAYVLREAYSNAYDATKATGDMTLPIEIVIPESTDFEDGITAKLMRLDGIGGLTSQTCPVVTVTDHGIGMSKEDVEHYFLQYGGSKKRNSQETIGSKGLGSKAPLAVTDTFEVRTRQNGIETRAVITRKPNKNVARITTEPTDEPNGTTVVIPVMDENTIRQMRECADSLMAYNVDANLVVNGKEARRIGDIEGVLHIGRVKVGTDEKGTPIEFDTYWAESDICTMARDEKMRKMATTVTNHKPVYHPYLVPIEPKRSAGINVVIGGYPYTMPDGMGNVRTSRYGYYGGRRGYWYVIGDPGYLNFTPSRDEIKQDASSTRFLNGVIRGIEKHDYTDFIKGILDGMTPHEVIEFVEQADRVVDARNSGIVSMSYSSDFIEVTLPRNTFDTSDGINLLDYANDVTRRYLDDDTSGRVAGTRIFHNDDKRFIGIRRFRSTQARSHWHINFTHDSETMNDARHAAQNAAANGELCGWDSIVLREHCYLSQYAKASGMVAILTNTDMDEKTVSSVVRDFAWFARALYGSKADNTGESLQLLLTADSDTGMNATEYDILKHAAGDKGLTVIDYGEVREKATELARQHRAELANERKNRNAGHTSVIVLDATKPFTTHQLTQATASIANGGLRMSDYHIVADLDDADIPDTLFCTILSDFEANAVAALMMLAIRNDAFGKDKHFDRLCLMVGAYAVDVQDVAAKGGRFAFDARRGNLKRPDTLLGNFDYAINGILDVPNVGSIAIRMTEECYAYRNGGKTHAYLCPTINATALFDDYDTERWDFVRRIAAHDSLIADLPYDGNATHTIATFNGVAGTKLAEAAKLLDGTDDIKNAYDKGDVADYKAIIAKEHLTDVGQLHVNMNDTTVAGNKINEQKRLLTDVANAIVNNGLNQLVTASKSCDETTQAAVRNVIVERINELVPEAMEVINESARNIAPARTVVLGERKWRVIA